MLAYGRCGGEKIHDNVSLTAIKALGVGQPCRITYNFVTTGHIQEA